FDVMAFRLYYRCAQARADARWLAGQLAHLAARYGDLPPAVEVLRTPDPSSVEAEAFLRRLAPDLMVVRCKRILKERVFSIPRTGTFVLHPGVCPEYRNAHGAFWALAERDLGNVGLTLLEIDRGVDTGPVYGYYSYAFDEINESHIVIMTRLVLENLDALRDKLLQIHRGEAACIDTTGRTSATWGHAWLSRYLRWKRASRNWRCESRVVARVSWRRRARRFRRQRVSGRGPGQLQADDGGIHYPSSGDQPCRADRSWSWDRLVRGVRPPPALF